MAAPHDRTLALPSGATSRTAIVAGRAFTAWVIAAVAWTGSSAWAQGSSDPSTNVPVAVMAGEQSEPAITTDGAHGAIMVWQDFRNGAQSDLYAQRLLPDGTPAWTGGGVAVCTAREFQTFPRIVPDGSGGAIIAWTDYRSGSADVYVQRIDANGNVLWVSDGRSICDDMDPQLGVEIAPDGTGGVIAVWEDYRGTDGDLYAQRVSDAGIPLWTLNGVPLCAATGNQSGPSVVSDGAGGAIVGWRDQRVGSAGDLYVQRIDSDGLPVWTPDGIVMCGAQGSQFDARLAPDGSGGAIAAWSDERNATLADIYAQRVGPFGTMLWSNDGVIVCAAASYQLFPVIAADGTGGAVIAWEDSRSDTTVDIYAQRMAGNGLPLWTSNGVSACTDPAYKALPAVCTNGGGSAIVVWQDSRNMGDDLYAQRIDASGTRAWGETGTVVCSAADSQLGPSIADDGSSGALFAWYDARDGDGDFDVYAQHVTSNGDLGGTVGIPPGRVHPGLELSAPQPNPAVALTRIRFALAVAGTVRVDVFDAAGRLVRTLCDQDLPAGSHSRAFDLRDRSGRKVAAGVYLVTLRANGATLTRRLVTLP